MPEMLVIPRNIILVGFMASGKSVVGEVLSRLTGMPLLDTDDEIVLGAGKPIHQIFEESGEAAFRELERSVIDNLCAGSGNVIAAGGGAFVDRDNQALMLASGLVFCLSAQPETIHRRITEPPFIPPLKRGEGGEFSPSQRGEGGEFSPSQRGEREELSPSQKGDSGEFNPSQMVDIQGSQPQNEGESEEGEKRGTHRPLRPLLAGDDPMGRITLLLAQRAGAYAQAHHTIETDLLTPEQVAGRILELYSARTAVNGE